VGADRLSTIPRLGIVNGVTQLTTKLAVVDNEAAGTYTPRSLQAAKAVRARRSFQQHFESGKRVRVRRIGFMEMKASRLTRT
jgi:hypothetical protein